MKQLIASDGVSTICYNISENDADSIGDFVAEIVGRFSVPYIDAVKFCFSLSNDKTTVVNNIFLHMRDHSNRLTKTKTPISKNQLDLFA